MSDFLAEILGTAILILLGNGVVANCVLAKCKGNGGGWIVITAGWGMAVATGIFAVGKFSGAHMNPAVTLGLASVGRLGWESVPVYVVAQLLGAILGAALVWVAYYPHWAETEDAEAKLACFATGPAVRVPAANLATEVIGTAVLLLGVLTIPYGKPEVPLSHLDPLLVGGLVFSIGLSLGGPTGYAINPARDLGPRIAHQLLPVAGKGSSDWGYAWIPVVGPLLGGVLGAWIYKSLWV